jgi:hypothetical protein
MRFGLANAPAMFTLMMNDGLGHFPVVLVFMDDVLVLSSSTEEYLQHLRVLAQLRKHRLNVARKKVCIVPHNRGMPWAHHPARGYLRHAQQSSVRR